MTTLLRRFQTSTAVVILFFAFSASLRAQGVNVPPRFVIDYPNASTIPRASFDLNLRNFANGGIVAGATIGMTDRFMLGVTFGGENVLGEAGINWHPFAGASARFRLVSETYTMPAVAIGFNSQGFGPYIERDKRFQKKSNGFYAVVSKNYEFFDHLSVHLGVNYSLEARDVDDDLNLFTGIDIGLSHELSILGEYDFALNDNAGGVESVGDGKGYLNAGIRYNIKDAVYFEFYFLDLLVNFPNAAGSQRAMKLTYFEFF